MNEIYLFTFFVEVNADWFTSVVVVNGLEFKGEGYTKNLSESQAAERASKHINNDGM